MNEKEFLALRYLFENKECVITQRAAAEDLNMSLGTVNTLIKKLNEKGFISNSYEITPEGMNALAPYKVNHAVILAAGMSTRFIPFSYEKPKGLTYVKGEILVERQIRQLKEAGVDNIVIVLGHMMEKFLYLADKYQLQVVVNKEYRYKNTHSSLFFARDYMESSYICCADNYFPQSVFHQYEYHSIYSVLYMPGVWRGERGVVTNEKGLIIDTNRPAVDQWVMNGYAFFNQSFGKKFKSILEKMWNTRGSEDLYWEQVYAEHVDELPLYAVRYADTDIYEFDSVEELEKFDPEFMKYNDISITKNISTTLNCSVADIHNICPMKKGYTNMLFSFQCNDKKYVYRFPGSLSSEWIDRAYETNVQNYVKKIEIDDSFIYEEPTEGWKISAYVEATEPFSFSNEEHVNLLCASLRKLYQGCRKCGKNKDYLQDAKDLLDKIQSIDSETYQIVVKDLNSIKTINAKIKKDKWTVQLVHNDLYEDNLLLSDGKLYIIDWEYAGDTDIGYDLCKLFVKNNASGTDIDKWLSLYYQRTPTKEEKNHIVGCAAVSFYYWYIWAAYMIKKGNDYSDLMYTYMKLYRKYQCEYYKNDYE